MIERLLDLPKKHSLFLFGPRQTGKSTMLRSSFSTTTTFYLDLLQSSEYLRLSANPALFREEVMAIGPEITHVIIDEVQRIPQLLDDVHSILESKRPRIFVLSGSSARKLKRSHANLLAGRAWTFHLYPLTSLELGERFLLSRALQYGTLPNIYLDNDDASAQRTLRSYVDTYLQEEIQIEANVRNVGSFYKFLTLAADASGSIVNYSSLAHDTGVPVNTMREFFRILEDTLIGSFLPAFTRSDTKRLIKHPKFLFFDTGVRNALLGRTNVALSEGTAEFGRSFEHFVILELIRINAYKEKSFRFSYYRTNNGSEVDLVAESPTGETWGVEIKASSDPNLKTAAGLHSFKDVVPHANLICACLAPRKHSSGGITILPWQDLFSELKLL
jgi:predicted AAA+ superfamily ATPase